MARTFEEVVEMARDAIARLDSSPELKFTDYLKGNRFRTDVFRTPGVYSIRLNDERIYFGMAGKGKHTLNFRLGDLFYYNPEAKLEKRKSKHTLTRKLLAEGRSMDEVRQFYKQECWFKTTSTKTAREARVVEAILIEMYDPRYNEE